MNRTKTNPRRFVCLLLCLILCLTVFPVSALALPAAETVRVGWYEDAYNITGVNGERSGYGYEFQQAVASYTNWNYDYVKAGWSDLLVMMLNGEIDIMSGVSYTDERAESMLFSELPMGEEKYYLYADLINTNISASDLSTLNGKRVGLLAGSVQATQFYEWEKLHDLKMQEVYVTSYEDAVKKVESREIDCLISTETPAWVEKGMSSIATVGGSDIYFVINKNRPDLKRKLDNAMRKMEYDKPFYADELYKRYLSAVSSPVLSKEEQIWLRRHGPIKIGLLNHDSGFSSIDENGNLVGVVNDYVEYASDCLKNQTLQFKLVGFETLDEELQALRDGDIDMIFHSSQNPYIAEINSFSLSNTVLSLNMAAVTTQHYFDESTETKVAICDADLMLKWYVSYNYPDWDIIEYTTHSDAEKAVLNGQADCLVAEAEQLNDYIRDSRFHSVFLSQPGNTSFAVNRGSIILLSVLNKTLKTMPSSMLAGALSMHESSARKVTLMDFAKDNLAALACVFVTLFTVILLVILSLLHKSRMAEAKARQAAVQSLELNKQLKMSQRELQAALMRAEAANSAKTTFLSNVSHDIRTPMNAIFGLTSLMENQIDQPDKIQEYLSKLKTSSQHLLNLINEILDMNKIESGKATLNDTSFTIAEQVAQVDSVIRPQAKARGQHFTVQTHNIKHENIVGDATRLQQVLQNILSNAVKYTQNGGSIDFDIEEVPRNGHYARYKFTVTDNGIGMSEEFQKHIYESFARAENSVTNKVQGTGLGMAITKSIVDMMGGSIALSSKLGEGSRFEVMLEFKIDENADNAVKKLSLLVLRCSDATLTRIQDATENHPIIVQRTTSPQETEHLLKDHHYDVILVPYVHYLDDLKASVQRVRRLAGKDTILLGTATAQRDEALGILAGSGLEGFVPLPFFLSNLETEISRAQEHRRSKKLKDASSGLAGMKFLCAEDNELNAEILQAMLEMQGASCYICHDGEEIVERFRTVQPGEFDAILMDVQMPKMNGCDAARAIRSGENPLGKTIPIIAMTANAFAEDVQRSHDAGMNAHLSKPVDIAMLEKTLRSFRKN